MPYPVYSTRFCNSSISSAGDTTLYTVPAGFRAVLRDVDIYFGGATGIVVELRATGINFVPFAATTTDPEPGVWRGRQVLNAGESLTVHVATLPAGGGLNVFASGYLLTLA